MNQTESNNNNAAREDRAGIGRGPDGIEAIGPGAEEAIEHDARQGEGARGAGLGGGGFCGRGE
jgi:hypothetical protein